MQVVRIQTNHHRIPPPKILSDSTYPQISSFDLVLVTLETDSGVSGTGYVKTIVDGSAVVGVLDGVLSSIQPHGYSPSLIK